MYMILCVTLRYGLITQQKVGIFTVIAQGDIFYVCRTIKYCTFINNINGVGRCFLFFVDIICILQYNNIKVGQP